MDPSIVHSDCFLGRGASGRVFRVRKKRDNDNRKLHNDDNEELALKVVLGTDGMGRLAQEALKMKTHASLLQEAGVTTTAHGYKEYPRREIGALLTGPVGIPIKRLKKRIRAALESLKQLNQKGLAHGDARWPNVIIIEEDGETSSLKGLWIDLRTLEEVESVEDQEQCFVHDMVEFYSSFNSVEATDQELEVRIRDYLADDSALEDLLDAM